MEKETTLTEDLISKMKVTIDNGGMKGIILKWSLYVVFPMIILYILFLIIKGKISPKVAIDVLNPGRNESTIEVEETGVTIEAGEAKVLPSKNKNLKKKKKSLSYISRVLEGLK